MEALKIEPMVGDVSDSVTVLWSANGEELSSFQIIQNDPSEVSKVEPSAVDPSLGDNHIDQSGEGDSIFKEEEDIGNETEEAGSAILTTDDVTEGHMLHVPETEGAILADQPETIQAGANLTSNLTTDTDGNVIQLFLPTDETGAAAGGQIQPLNISLGGSSLVTNSVVSPATQTVQAITLSDGTTAFIQHPMTSVNIVTSLPNNGTDQIKPENVENTIKLEDTCTTISSINQAVKDGLQAIILEDGTTAYLATQQTPQLIENGTLETTTLTLDQLTAPNLQVLPNGMVNLDVKTLAIPAQNGVTTNGTVEEEQQQQPAAAEVKIVSPPATTTPVPEKLPFVEKAYKCSYDGCGRYYTTLHHLRVHERSHTGDRPFRCEVVGCGKAFATGYGLKSHTRVHTGEKPYKCPEETCEKAFKTSGDLMKHVRTHTGERPFKCPFEGCTRSFTTSNIRKVHIRTHTGERPYICPEEGCGRAFASATNYKNHVRIHTGEKPYVCTVQGCGKRFTEYSSLYKHHVVHTHAKPYTCNRCGKTYRQTSTLAMHKRTTHGEDVTAESEALLYQEQSQGGGLEPPEKRSRLGFNLNQDEMQDEGEGTLIINTADTGQQMTLIGSNTLNVGNTDTIQTLPSPTATLEQMGVATFTLGDQGQQVYVITDPAQLEALQQIAQHQFDTETIDTSLITALPSADIAALDPTESGITTVTEITSTQDIIDSSVAINTTATIPDI